MGCKFSSQNVERITSKHCVNYFQKECQIGLLLFTTSKAILHIILVRTVLRTYILYRMKFFLLLLFSSRTRELKIP